MLRESRRGLKYRHGFVGTPYVIFKFWTITLVILLVASGVVQAQTWYLSPAGAANAQTNTGWWSAEGGTGTQYAGNFQETGLFIVPDNINGVVTADWQLGGTSNNNVTMTVEGSLTIDDGVTLSLRRLGNGSASITVSSGGSLIFLGTSANQISGNSSTNTVTVSAGATLITANSNGIRGAATSSFVPAANQLTTTLDVAANYVFNGADQTTTGLPSTVNNLTLSGSGTKTLNAATTVNGNFVMAGTASFSTAADLT